MPSFFDHTKLSPLALSVWKRGGLDTLVKVGPLGRKPDPNLMIGDCTAFKYVVGRTPAEMEQILGIVPGTKFVNGVDVFTISPLPDPSQFELKGYGQCPGGMPADAPSYVSHPIYPPGLGAPRWDLARVPQSALVWIATVPRGQVFGYDYRRLPMVR